jgi:hypothetical protein
MRLPLPKDRRIPAAEVIATSICVGIADGPGGDMGLVQR